MTVYIPKHLLKRLQNPCTIEILDVFEG